MTDNIDTPQSANPNTETDNAFEGPWPTQTEDSNNASVEEAFFGSQETTEPQEQASPEQVGTPESAPIQEQAQEYNAKNDEKRFEYWQSQASKNSNQVADIQKQNQELQAQMNAMQTMQQPVAEPVEQFPSAPERPKKPRTFSREEAYADPNSESARYLDEYEGWRDDMNEYSALKSEYQGALMEERLGSYEQQRVHEAKRQQAMQQKSNQESEVRKHVMGHYGMQENEANDFLNKMSDPNSITVDNLVQLYRLQGSGNAQQASPPTAPSQTFTQTKNAQQVPSPMGVMPSGNSNVDGRTVEDRMIDTMIGDFNSKNPWK